MALSALLSPIRIGPTEVRNRVVVTAHGASESFRNPGASPDSYIEYLRRRAAGGVGMIIAQPPFFQHDVEYGQWVVDRHGRLAETVQAEGAVILLQLAHLGAFARSDPDVHRPALWGFGATTTAAGETSHAMTDDEVESMVDAYRRTARMAADAGFDGVEVHGGHGYLIQQSLTPLFNDRSDRWGVDRSLFARRVLTEARREMGVDRIVSYRTTTNDLRSPEDGGIGFEHGADLLRRILATAAVDVLNTTIGDGGASYARAIPNYRYVEPPNIPEVVRLRAAAGVVVPVIGTGRIASLGMAEAVLAAGSCDLVGMTRAHIADPDVVAKATAGAAERIRPCVGSNVCVDRKLAGFSEISCFHNPEVLREVELAVEPAAVRRRVLVVGAGPAGLKAAEVAARRGHDVTILDPRPPGGRLRSAAHTPASALVGAVEHLVAELAQLGVEVGCETVTEEVLRNIRPDGVVVATGGRPDPAAAFPGAAEAGAIDGADALITDLGPAVVVYDTVGANEGALVAESIAARGHRVTFVTPYEVAMPQGGQLHRFELPATLFARVDRVLTRALIGVADEAMALVVTPEGDTIAEQPFDSLVTVTPSVPDVRLASVLDGLGVPYRIVGDAVAPRLAAQAFKDGHEAGVAL